MALQIGVRLHLRRNYLPHPDGALPLGHIKLDWHIIYAEDFPNQRSQVRQRPAELTGVRGQDGLFLLWRRLVVHMDGDSPVALETPDRQPELSFDFACLAAGP